MLHCYHGYNVSATAPLLEVIFLYYSLSESFYDLLMSAIYKLLCVHMYVHMLYIYLH